MPDPLLQITAAGSTDILGGYDFVALHNGRPYYQHTELEIRIWWGTQVYSRWMIGIRLNWYGTDVYYDGQPVWADFGQELLPFPTAGPWGLGDHPDAAMPLPIVGEWSAPLGPSSTNLLIEGLGNPTRVMNPVPDITWDYVPGDTPGDQAAYRILAASDPELLEDGEADLWDSGVIAGNASVATYAGLGLGDNEMVFYRVMVKDPDDNWSYP